MAGYFVNVASKTDNTEANERNADVMPSRTELTVGISCYESSELTNFNKKMLIKL